MASGVGLGNWIVNSIFVCFVHVNVNSLVNKVSYIHNFIVDHDADVVGISETWLNHEIEDVTVSVPGFDIIRRDSPSGIRKHGVAAYVKQSLKYEVVNVDIPNLLCLYLVDYKVYHIVVYRPPIFKPVGQHSANGVPIGVC